MVFIKIWFGHFGLQKRSTRGPKRKDKTWQLNCVKAKATKENAKIIIKRGIKMADKFCLKVRFESELFVWKAH